MARMKAAIFVEPGRTVLDEKPVPDVGPLDALFTFSFAAGLGDHRIITTLCPGGKERMRRLMNVVASDRVDLKPLVTHRFNLDQIEAAYDLFASQHGGVLALTP